MDALLSNGWVQVLALPKVLASLQNWLARPRESAKPADDLLFTPSLHSDPRQTALALVTIAGLALRCLLENPAARNPFAAEPLSLNASPAAVRAAFARSTRLRPDSGTLIHRLASSPDARATYARLGERPLLRCAWCAPPPSADHFLYALVAVAAQYLVLWLPVSVILGLHSARPPESASATSPSPIISPSPPSPPSGLRSGLALAFVFAFAYEAAALAGWPVPATATTVFVGDRLWLIRHTVLILLVATAWLGPSFQPRRRQANATAIPAPGATSRLSSLLTASLLVAGRTRHDISAGALQRIAIMRDERLSRFAAAFHAPAQRA